MIQPPPRFPTFEEFQRNPDAFDERNERARKIHRGNVITIVLLAGSGCLTMLIVAGIFLATALGF